MAPSTATPSHLHRAPVACLKCRGAKVRCLVSQMLDRCQRCIAHDTDCVFTQSKRSKKRAHPDSGGSSDPIHARQQPRGQIHQLNQHGAGGLGRHESPALQHGRVQSNRSQPDGLREKEKPLITPEIRSRIVTTLTTLRGKRGAPFSFVTSGEGPVQEETSSGVAGTSSTPCAESSLNLSSLLRPLVTNRRAQSIGDSATKPISYVKMPTYAASMSLGQTVKDPIDGGMLSVEASTALFEQFMDDINIKWEYLLDPRFDTHDNVRARSPLLFSSVLFCSSKFASPTGSGVSPIPDPYLQTRLCSLARSLAIHAFANGDRSIETMQAFYLLVCWKDPEDTISYLHSGYAFRILQQLDLRSDAGDKEQIARRRRTWLALFRQDIQQSLFFVRTPSMAVGDESPTFLMDMDAWLQNPFVSPIDVAGCCSADIRRIQSKLRILAQRSSSLVQPCILEVMHSDLGRWRTTWQSRFSRHVAADRDEIQPLHLRISHWKALMGLWEHSVRLNIASIVLRQVLTISATNIQGPQDEALVLERLDVPGIGQVPNSDVPGLRESADGALGTIQSLLAFSVKDLRKSPDSVLLLGPNAALFLCLLLVFPCDGFLGVHFQKTAIGLITDLARHIGKCIESSQDIANLHSAYLDSLVTLVSPESPDSQDFGPQSSLQQPVPLSQSQLQHEHSGFGEAELQTAQDLAGMTGPGDMAVDNQDYGLTQVLDLDASTPNLADLLDTCFFWDMPVGV